MVNIEIKQLYHRGKNNIGLFFNYDEKLIEQIRAVGCSFSKTHKCWYIENSPENNKKVENLLKVKEKATINMVSNLSESAQNELHSFREFLETKRYSLNTISTYIDMAKLILKYMNDKPIHQIKEADVQRFKEEIATNRNYSINTQRQVLKVLKLFFDGNQRMKVELSKVTTPKKEFKLPEVLLPEEILKILGVIENIKHKAIISLLYASGLRISELINLRISDINYSKMELRLINPKAKASRHIALSHNLLPVLNDYCKAYHPQNYLFYGQNGKRYSMNSIRKALKNARLKAGIKKRISPHTLRHSYSVHMLQQGVGLTNLQELLGHSRVESTKEYIKVAEKQLSKIVSPFDLLFKNEVLPARDMSTFKMLKGSHIPEKLGGYVYF